MMNGRQYRQSIAARACVLLVAIHGLLVVLPTFAQATIGDDEAPARPADEIKSLFDEAMAKPLGERVPLLEALEDQLDVEVFEGTLVPTERIVLLDMKYRVQKHLAQYPESRRTFGQYAAALHQWQQQRSRARVILIERVRHMQMSGDQTECAEVVTPALEYWGDDPEVCPALLYYQARSLSDLTGRAKEAVPILQRIVAEHVDSEWRPKAMRWLAHLEANGYGGGHKAALGTLSLMEQQYRGTWWEQYAHMKPAVIFEKRMGEPQKAIARYQETLERYPDHVSATFCRREIGRLQKVIEQQLIQDALEGLGKQPERAEPEDAVGLLDRTPEQKNIEGSAPPRVGRLPETETESPVVEGAPTG